MPFLLAVKFAIASALLFSVAHSTPSAAQEPVSSFSMHRGVNVVGPFVRIKALPSNSDGQISDFQGMQKYPDWYNGKELRQAGYDFIRLPVNPALLLENPPIVRARMLDGVEEDVRPFLSAGLRVAFDLHLWVPVNKVWNQNTIVSGDPSAFAAYRALVRELAFRLARYPHGEVALELFNEPINLNCQSIGWISQQKVLLSDVRAVAPVLPVVVSGCLGSLDGLVAMKKSDIDMKDKNLIYTFHFYDPFLFTHQGGYNDFLYIEGVPYPASLGNIGSTVNVTNHNIDGSVLPLADALAVKARAAKQITQYFAQAPNRAFVERRFDEVVAWAKSNDVSPSQILLGEFAAINWRKTDTPEYLRARRTWDEDVQSAAEQRGIAWAFWYLPYPKGPLFR